ncbi:MAG: hypothetical protein II060_00175, partial [Bacteroidales bacterium]|nr:hypothetical protein [Bacteroidales bacterium]
RADAVSVFHVSMASPFLSFYAYGVSMGYARFLLSRGALRLYNVSVSMITPFLLRRNVFEPSSLFA